MSSKRKTRQAFFALRLKRANHGDRRPIFKKLKIRYYDNMKKYENAVLFAVLCLACFIFCSCGQRKKNNDYADLMRLNIKSVPHSVWTNSRAWSESEKKICIVFGYGYNGDEFISKIKAELSEKYGLAEDGGLIIPLLFPGDFKVSGRDRISMLPEILRDVRLKGIIFLGAPENTHNAVSVFKNLYDGEIPFPIFSFFPQDDVLGMEWTADFVLDEARPQDAVPAMEESVVVTDEVSLLLDSSVRYMTLLDSPLPPDSDLILHVRAIAEKYGKISRYVDPETGLLSVNHFVLKAYE